jgi:hypothetical protein
LSPPFNVSANTKYWVAAQATLVYRPQWGWGGHETGTLLLTGAYYGFPLVGTNYWIPILARADMDFCLGGVNPQHPCALNGDVNGDGLVNNFDINAFIYALTHTQAQFEAQYPTGNYWCADGDCNLVVNNFDINKFVDCLTGSPSCVNCP